MLVRTLGLKGVDLVVVPHFLEKGMSAAKTLGLKEVDTRRCASKDAEPQRGSHSRRVLKP